MSSYRNWSGGLRFTPRRIERPASVEEVVEAVRSAGGALRVAGSGHSFTALLTTEGTLLSLERLRGIASVDPATSTVDVLAGTPLHELSPALLAHGLAFPSLGDIDRQTVAGAFSTGTHGTGLAFRNLSSAVTGLTLVDGRGRLVTCSEQDDPDLLRAARVGLGALGVIVSVRLRLVPAFVLAEERRVEPLDVVLGELPERLARHRHFEFFWFPHTGTVQSKALDATDAPAQARGLGDWANDIVLENGAFGALCWLAAAAPGTARGVSRLCARLASGARRVGRSHRIFASPRLVRFEEMEYALPAQAGPAALRELASLVERRFPEVHFPVEYRQGAGDDAWLSPAHGRASAYVAVHVHRAQPFERYFAEAEAVLRAHGGRPHWGKRHALGAAELRPLYPRWDDFQAQRRRLDPDGVLLSPYLRHLLG